MGENIFEVRSPLGYIVICSQVTWEQHVLIGHPVMQGKENELKSTIEAPDYIFESEEHPKDRNVYFKYNALSRKYIKAVTKGDLFIHYIVSAWLQNELKGNIGGLKYVKHKL